MLDTRGLASGTRSVRLRIIERLLVAQIRGPFSGSARTATAGHPPLRCRAVGVAQHDQQRGDHQRRLAWLSALARDVRRLGKSAAGRDRFARQLEQTASLPRALQSREVGRVLNSFTPALRAPKRGYAIVRLALDLGLRCIEINRLQLDDIDRQNGTLTLRRTKSRRQDVLPLPVPTGKALEAYLRHERPLTSNRSVFVRSLAPHHTPVSVDAIHRVIRDAFSRAGIPHGRAHALRHTLACRLVTVGARSRKWPTCCGTAR